VPSAQRAPRLPPEVRREQLLDAAREVIGEGGFDALTIEAVAQRAGVTRPVVYDLFGDLDAMVTALIDREERAALAPLLEIVGDAEPDAEPEEFLLDATVRFLDAVHSDPATWRLLLMPPQGVAPAIGERFDSSRRLIADRVTALLDWGIAKRGGPEGLDHELFARLIVAAGEDAARLTLRHPRRFPPDRLASLARSGAGVLPAGARPRGASPPAPLDLEPQPAEASPRRGARRVPRRERREQILDVTLELIAEDGWEALNMGAIARRAGVNRAIVYRSFPNLQLLLLALLRREEARTSAMLDGLLPSDPLAGSAPDLLFETLARFLGAVLREPLTYRVVLQRPESAPFVLRKLVDRRRAEMAQRLTPLVEVGLAGIAAPTEEIDVEVLARLLLSTGEELARLALDDSAFPPARVLASCWALLDVVPLR
jgi:AcrR family transcriptional regulator